MVLRLLHLSDIHFSKADDAGAWDLNHELRRTMEDDAERLAATVGGIDAVLVTGDIAATGTAAEYAIAGDWLVRLCQRIGCGAENVWTVPGNHDVDRRVIRNGHIVPLLHDKIRTCDEREIDEQLSALLNEDPTTADLLMAPLSGYNDFAARYGCQISAAKPYWERDFPLSSDLRMRIRGMTTVLVSDEHDDRWKAPLALGSMQTRFEPEQDVAVLTMGHHPFEWLRDGRSAKSAVLARVAVALFGHEHEYTCRRTEDTLEVVAGAAHPSRREGVWDPRYNMLTISAEGRTLGIDVYARQWNPVSRTFAPDSRSHPDPRHEDLRLPDTATIQPVVDELTRTVPTISVPDGKPTTTVRPDDDPYSLKNVIGNPARLLAFRFGLLSFEIRYECLRELSLLPGDANTMRDQELFTQAFRNARDCGKLADLWDLVDARTPESISGANPFRAHDQEAT